MTETANIPKFGSREAVYLGIAQMTKGKLTKADLTYDERSNQYKSLKLIANGKRMVEMMKAKAAEAPGVSVKEHVERIEKELAQPAPHNEPQPQSELVADMPVKAVKVVRHRKTKSVSNVSL